MNNFIHSFKDRYFHKIFHLSWNLIKKNYLIWIIFSLFVLSQPFIIILIDSMGYELVDKSLFISLIPQAFLLILNFLLINKIFSEAKTNGVDSILLSLPISKTKMFLSRFTLIFLFGFIGLAAQFILDTILVLSFQVSSTWIAYFFISNIFINSFTNIFLISLIVILAIALRRIWFAVVSIICIILFSAPIVTRNTNQDNVKITYNQQNSDSFSKLSLVSNNKFETYIVDQTNDINIFDNRNTINEINSIPIYNYFIPGEIITTFNSSLLKNLISTNDNDSIDKKYSLIKDKYTSVNFSNYDHEYENALILRPEDINPLTLNDEEYENLLLSNIDSIIKNNNDYIDLSNNLLAQNLLDNLQNYQNVNWINLNSKDIKTLNLILGVNTKYNQLFYFQRNYQWLSNKTPNLLNKIATKYSENLANLFEYLWTSEVTQNNINNTFDNINPVFPNIDNLYPSIMVVNDNAKPLKSDIDFLKNDIIRFNGNTIGYLTINGSYKNVNSLTNIDPSITDENSWKIYVEQNTLSLSDAKSLVETLSSNFSDLVVIDFSPNQINLNKFSYYFTSSNSTYLTNAQIYVTALSFIYVGIFWLSIETFEKKNYKNDNYEK